MRKLISRVRVWWLMREARKCMNTGQFFLAHGEHDLAQEFALQALEYSAKAKAIQATQPERDGRGNG